MSDREQAKNASRKGRSDFWKGVALSACPLRAGSSRQLWMDAWKEEQAWMEKRNADLYRHLSNTPVENSASAYVREVREVSAGIKGAK